VNNHIPLFFASRTLIESVVRGLFRKLPNITLLERTAVTGIAAARRNTLEAKGVHVTPLDGGAPTTLVADLIVDASGRASKAPDPSQLPREWWWKGVWIDLKLPEHTFAGVLFPIEHGRWLVTLAGVSKNYPPSDEAGFMATLHQLRSPIIAEMVRFAEPISPVYSNRAMANRFRHYEQWKARLDGFVALGDAVCAFNPVYGQGMTTGTVSATILCDCLKQYDPATPTCHATFSSYKRVFNSTHGAWRLARIFVFL
jgi:2-polyprenyl-6-methoxyphenol hydroxylase-like FAD-dependent oxidoreductase